MGIAFLVPFHVCSELQVMVGDREEVREGDSEPLQCPALTGPGATGHDVDFPPLSDEVAQKDTEEFALGVDDAMKVEAELFAAPRAAISFADELRLEVFFVGFHISLYITLLYKSCFVNSCVRAHLIKKTASRDAVLLEL